MEVGPCGIWREVFSVLLTSRFFSCFFLLSTPTPQKGVYQRILVQCPQNRTCSTRAWCSASLSFSRRPSMYFFFLLPSWYPCVCHWSALWGLISRGEPVNGEAFALLTSLFPPLSKKPLAPHPLSLPFSCIVVHRPTLPFEPSLSFLLSSGAFLSPPSFLFPLHHTTTTAP